MENMNKPKKSMISSRIHTSLMPITVWLIHALKRIARYAKSDIFIRAFIMRINMLTSWKKAT